jgi:putative transposon-encoded protein
MGSIGKSWIGAKVWLIVKVQHSDVNPQKKLEINLEILFEKQIKAQDV